VTPKSTARLITKKEKQRDQMVQLTFGNQTSIQNKNATRYTIIRAKEKAKDENHTLQFKHQKEGLQTCEDRGRKVGLNMACKSRGKSL